MQDTIETIKLWFDCTVLNPELSNPENLNTDLKIGMLDIPIYPSLNSIPKPYRSRYYAIGLETKYSLYGVLPSGGLKEIWVDRG